jgi:acyl carrier protein
MDSLDVAEILINLEVEFGVEIDDYGYLDIYHEGYSLLNDTVGALVRAIEKKLEQKNG